MQRRLTCSSSAHVLRVLGQGGALPWSTTTTPLATQVSDGRLPVSPRYPELCFSACGGTTAAITPCAEGINRCSRCAASPSARRACPSPPAPLPPRVAGSDGSVAIYRTTGTESSTLQLGIANVLVSRPRLHRIGRRFHEHEPPPNAL